MRDCRHCRFASWDYEEFYNCRDKQWFVDGCIKDLEVFAETDCEEFEDHTDELG